MAMTLPWRPWLVCVLCVLLAACGQSRVVRRYDHPSAMSRSTASSYTVRQGDTLYGIAFRNQLDFRDVAAWNQIKPPFTIYPGQRLRLSPAVASRVSVARTTVMQTPAQRTPPAPARATPPIAHVPSSTTATAVTAEPPTRTAITAPPTSAQPNKAPVAVSVPVTSVFTAAPGRWVWPTAGQVIGRYVGGDPTQQGIDIAGTAGQPVLATADGVVVYSGTGLVGYGEVIIVKHSDEWLSAYGHNRQRLVAEGATVKGGQPIAELGRSGTSRDMLHFEIRRNGKPVDPLTLLGSH